jgi:DNA-binding MarR family transcriptional regulator
MSTLPNDLPDCTVFLLGKAYQKAHGDFQKRLKPYGLTNMQHLVLEGLWYRPGITAAELGKYLILDKATLSGVLDRMVEADWIFKKQDEEDRRVSLNFPSDKSYKLKDKLIAERKKANASLLKEFSLE